MDNKERILQAAHELFFGYGIKSITMDDIARHLSMSKKTIYQYFKDKNHLVNSLTSHILDIHQCQFKEIADSSKDAIHEIVMAMKHTRVMFTEMNPNLFYDMQKFHPESWEMFRKFKEDMILGMVIENLETGIEQGLYREDINKDIIARLRIEEVEMALNPQAFSPAKYNVSVVQEVLLDHFLYGIATLKGLKLIDKYKKLMEEE